MSIREKLKWLDPFTYVDLFILPKINPSKNEMISWIVYLVFAFAFAWMIYTGLGLLLGTASPMVIVVSGSMEPNLYRGDVVVLTGATVNTLNAPVIDFSTQNLSKVSLDQIATLQPLDDKSVKVNFFTGQELTVPHQSTDDVIVYFSEFKRIEIIHRAVAKIKGADGTFILTKGDNNPLLDQDCGPVESVPGSNGKDLLFPLKPCASPRLIPESVIRGKMLFKLPLVGYVKLLIFDDLQTLLFGCPLGQGRCQFP